MEELIQEQNKALTEFCDRLNERKVAAKIEESDTGKILTVLLPGMPDQEELYTDIFFYTQDERMEQVSFCSMRTEIRDLTGMEMEEVNTFCRKISELNSALPIGGYGTKLTDDELQLKTLVFTATIPIVPEIRGEKLTETLEDTLALVVQTIARTLPEI